MNQSGLAAVRPSPVLITRNNAAAFFLPPPSAVYEGNIKMEKKERNKSACRSYFAETASSPREEK